MKDRIIYLLKAIGVVYLLYFLCRLTFFLFQYPKFIESTFWGIIKAFFVGTLFDTVSISYSNSLFIILVALPFVSLQNRIVKGLLKSWLVVSNAIATALNLIDVVYFDYSQRRTGDEILVLGHNTGDLLGTYLTDFWHIILIFICYVAFLGIFAYRLRTPHTYLPHTSRQWGLSMGTFLIVTGFCVLGMRGGLFRTPLLTQDAAKFVDAKLVAVATNTPHQIIATIQAENLKAKALMDIA
ncbi:MAG TPA: hypothetical protein VL947_13215, partial [Cytophagales bacterium]|nr:hypothetical protein [Cytophagales bacterium]